MKVRGKSAAIAEGVVRAFDLTGDFKKYRSERKCYSNSLHRSWGKVGRLLTAVISEYPATNGIKD